MLNRAHIAADITEEVQAFIDAHEWTRGDFIDKLGTSDHLLRRLARGGNCGIDMLGRMRDVMKAADPKWQLQDDHRDAVHQAAIRFRHDPSPENQKRLNRAVDAFERWPVQS